MCAGQFNVVCLELNVHLNSMEVSVPEVLLIINVGVYFSHCTKYHDKSNSKCQLIVVYLDTSE